MSKSLQDKTTDVWNQVYVDFEPNRPLGIEYPTEALIVHVANQRKGMSLENYYDDKKNEYSIKRDYSGNALEIGFGTIANLKMVRQKGFQCYGLEVSDEAVKRGKVFLEKDGINGVELQSWTPPSLPYAENFFSFVYGMQCIYYNLDLETVLEEVRRTLVPGGNFLFSFFADSSGYMKYIEKVDEKVYRWSVDHPNPRLPGACFRYLKTEAELKQLFSKFKDVVVYKTESTRPPMVDAWWYVTGKK